MLWTKQKGNMFQSSLAPCVTCIVPFDLWMSQAKYDIFIMVVGFINNSWEPTYVIGIFEVHNTIGVDMEN
jgi:hypothetical protein